MKFAVNFFCIKWARSFSAPPVEYNSIKHNLREIELKTKGKREGEVKEEEKEGRLKGREQETDEIPL